MKNSDIKNFEKHLNNYLNFIRKYNKDFLSHSNKELLNNPVLNDENDYILDKKFVNKIEKEIKGKN